VNPAIVPFDISIYEEVIALWMHCEGVGLGEGDSKQAIGTYLERNPGMSFVAKGNGKIVGAVLAGHDGRRGYLYHLAVDAGWRRQGIARLLVEKCLDALKASGIQKTHLFIFTNNTNGVAFWKSIGWTYRNDINVISKTISPCHV